jgi:amino acid adenylation domain-containing protein
MTALQRSMVLASLRAPRDGVYLVQDVCELNGPFDVALLHEAWRAVVRRHPAIACAVSIRDGDPAGFHADDRASEYWREEDCSNVEDFLRGDREQGFDFEVGAPVRIAVIRALDNSITLVWTVHHCLLDGRSLTLAWQEWLANYDVLVDGRHLPVAPPEPVPACVVDPNAEQFWRDYLRGLSQTTDYIVERIRPDLARETEPIARERVVLSGDVTRQLREHSTSQGVTVNNLVQGAWALLLSRYSGRSDIVFGVTRSGRTSSPDDASDIGFYINTLPLRVEVEPRATLGPWLRELRNRWRALRNAEHTPLHQAAKWGDLPPGMPPFESLLNYDHEQPGDTLRNLGGRWSGATLRRLQRTDSSLTLAAWGSPVLTLEVIFDTGRFSRRTIAAAAGHLKELLESFVSQPDARLCDLNMLSAEERRLLLSGRTRMPLPALCAHQLFEERAEKSPTDTAIDSGFGCITYGELNERANVLAWDLLGAGVRAKDLVAICTESSPESVIAALAVLKTGAAFVPIDPGLPEQRLEAIVSDAHPSLILCNEGVRASIRNLGWETRTIDTRNFERSPQSAVNPPNTATPCDLAYTIYTSGSSGQPKAVEMPHRGLVNHSLAASSVYGISETDRRLQMASIGTDVFIAEVFNYLCRGAALVFGWDRRNRSVREFLHYIDERQITITGMPSAWWNEWMAAVEQSGAAPPKCLRAVIIGMEKAEPATFLKWKKLAGNTARLFNAYGPTEASPTSTIYEAGSSAWEADSYVPIGKPLANTSVYVLDEHGSPVPAGVAGGLYIGGAGVARGYSNRPELTAEKFVPNLFESDESSRLYRTGDTVFYLPDGNLVFVGREDRQVKIRGFRVELDEVETVLSGYKDVRQCAVELAGEGEKRFLGAFVAFRSDAPAGADIRSYLAKRVPEHMMPTAFVTMPALPLTPGGKIDRQALPLWKLERVLPESGFQALSTETEVRLAEIWRRVLHVWPIGASDSFFALGADSLDATRLLTLVEEQFGMEVPASLFWRVPTLGGMALVLERRELPSDLRQDTRAVVPLQPHGSRIPVFSFPGNDDPAFFLPLAASLGNEQPFYAVRDPRPIAERGDYTVEEQAERLVKAVRQVRIKGPYVLVGHCFGGLAAFEAARRLAAAGETVSKVILIDVSAPGYPKVVRKWKQYRQVAMQTLRGERRVAWADARLHARVLLDLGRKRAAFWTRRVLRGTPARAILERQVELTIHPNARAGRDYDPRPFACDLVQIISTGEPHRTEILDDPRLGWRDLAKMRFTVTEVEGAAGAICKPPCVSGLAAQIKGVLDTVNTEP